MPRLLRDELLARVCAILRRSPAKSESAPEALTNGDFEIDPAA